MSGAAVASWQEGGAVGGAAVVLYEGESSAETVVVARSEAGLRSLLILKAHLTSLIGNPLFIM
jgi:hypothetical protein